MKTSEIQNIMYNACRIVHSKIVNMKSIGGIGEESLTDILLSSIHEQLQGIFLTWKHTKRAEGSRTGADWEWWICYNNTYYCFHIQAKKFSGVLSDY